jgi:hypothetical protein
MRKLQEQANKLSLNTAKTQYLIISNNLSHKNMKICYKDKELQQIGHGQDQKCYKYLGLLMDEKLNWQAHANKILSSLNSGIYALTKLQRCSSFQVRKTVYNALFRSHLDYMLPVWAACKKDIFNKIKRKQKRAIRLVCGITDNCVHTSELYKKCGVLKLDDMYHQSALKCAFKYKELFQKKHNVQTREHLSSNLSLPDVIPPNQTRMPSICLPNIWNSSSDTIKTLSSEKSISRQVYVECMLSY